MELKDKKSYFNKENWNGLYDTEIEYRNEASHNYLSISLGHIEKASFREKMMTENTIPGLINVKSSKINNRTTFIYDISSMQAISILYEKNTYSATDMQNILRAFYKTVQSMEPYFLDVNNIMLVPEMIFMNIENGGVGFIYNPYYKKSIVKQLEELTMHFIERVDYSDQDSTYIAFILNQKILRDGFGIDSLLEVFENNNQVEEKNITSYSEEETYVEKVAHITVKDDYKENNFLSDFIGGIKKKLTYKKKINTEVVCESEEYITKATESEKSEEEEYIGQTVLLSETKMNVISFKPDKPYFDEFELFEKSIVIGKMEDKVDVVIKDPSVSRIHAKCEREGDRFYIEDLNTTNGTYLDNRKMVPYKMEEIFDGSRVRFGQVGYCVVIR